MEGRVPGMGRSPAHVGRKVRPGATTGPGPVCKSLLDELTHSERVAAEDCLEAPPAASRCTGHRYHHSKGECTETVFLEAGVLYFDKPHDRILAFANLYPLDTGKQVLEKLLREPEHSATHRDIL